MRSALSVSALVVIVDDGSREPLRADGARVVRLERNRGPAAAMNAGVAAAIERGARRICRLDVGDSYRVDAKLAQLDVDAPAIFSPHFDLVDGKAFTPVANWANRIYTDGQFCICSMVISVDAWQQVGGFDESLRWGDDWDFAMRVQKAIGWTMFDGVTCEAGVFAGGHTKSADADPIRRQLRHDCLVRCLEQGQRLKRKA